MKDEHTIELYLKLLEGMDNKLTELFHQLEGLEKNVGNTPALKNQINLINKDIEGLREVVATVQLEVKELNDEMEEPLFVFRLGKWAVALIITALIGLIIKQFG